MELQEAISKRGMALPFVIITAHGDVPTARAAFRFQAVDFLEKPFGHAQFAQLSKPPSLSKSVAFDESTGGEPMPKN